MDAFDIIWKGWITLAAVVFLLGLRFLPDPKGEWPRSTRLLLYLWIPSSVVIIWIGVPSWVFLTVLVGLASAVGGYYFLPDHGGRLWRRPCQPLAVRRMNTNAYHRLQQGLWTVSGLAFSVFGGTLVYAAFVVRQPSPVFRFSWGIIGVAFALLGVLRIIGLHGIANKLCPLSDRGWLSFVAGALVLLLGLFRGPHLSLPFRDFPWTVPLLGIGMIIQGALEFIHRKQRRSDSGSGE